MSAAALIAAFGMAQAAPAPAPSPLFAAFKAACFNLKGADGNSAFDTIAPAAKAAGWTEVAEADADPRIARITPESSPWSAASESGATVNKYAA